MDDPTADLKSLTGSFLIQVNFSCALALAKDEQFVLLNKESKVLWNAAVSGEGAAALEDRATEEAVISAPVRHHVRIDGNRTGPPSLVSHL
jgi:hypothetical protein